MLFFYERLCSLENGKDLAFRYATIRLSPIRDLLPRQRSGSAVLWTWVDAHGKKFGIGHPYLGRDLPHVAPIGGREYAKHNRGTKQAPISGSKIKSENP